MNSNFKTKSSKRPIFILTVFLFISNLILAQSVNDLDIKNGFLHFKLGSSPSQIKDIVKQENQFLKNPNVVAYDYVGNDIDYILNVKVNRVSLSFFKNKLFSIIVSFGSLEQSKDFEVYEFNGILFALEKTYGTDWIVAENSDGIILNSAVWDAKNVTLEFLRLDFSKSKTNPENFGFISGYITVYDKKIMNEMSSSNF